MKDYTGFRNEMLVVLGPAGEVINKRKIWLCQCDCGNKSYVMTGNLVRTKSCGCLREKNMQRIGKRPKKTIGDLENKKGE